jgi:hypothetical protein
MSASAEVQNWRARLRRDRLLAFVLRHWLMATAALTAVTLLALLVYVLAVFRYAPIAELEVLRTSGSPDCAVLRYRPLAGGAVRFGYDERSRQAEVLHRISSGDAGQAQELRWRIEGLQAGDMVRVTYRQGWRRAKVAKLVPDLSAEAVAPKSAGVYARRTKPGRLRWIGDLGGSSASEQAVTDGLHWLARHQAADGSWSCTCLGSGPASRCEKDRPCTLHGEAFEMAHTGLALLALQGAGHYEGNCTTYSSAVRRGLEWTIGHQQADGALVGSQRSSGFAKYHKNHMYEHGIAAYALGDACASAAAIGRPLDEVYLDALRKAVEFIEKQQHNDGGWRYTDNPREPGDTSVTGWQVFALRAAQDAGLPTADRCLKKLDKFFQLRETGTRGQTGYQNRNVQTDATTGAGMLARQFLFDEPRGALVSKAADYLAELAENTYRGRAPAGDDRDYYLWYHCSLAMLQAGGTPGKRWNDAVRDTVIKLQRHEGCARGSWEPDDRWGTPGGRIYSTAMAILTLEAYYRYTLSDETISP